MASASITQVLAAARQWLKPLVHVLVRCGVTWKDFAELAKTAYVEVATEQFGKRGRLTNVSRTAVLTGLARREVRKQRELIDATPGTYIPQTMDEQLIRLWGTIIADVATTYRHNLTRNPGRPTRFERAAPDGRISASALPEFRDFLNREGQAFLERIDAWLTDHEAHAREQDS